MKETVTIRSAAVQDTAIMLEIYAPYILESAVSFETELPTMEEFQKSRNVSIQYSVAGGDEAQKLADKSSAES